MPTEAERQAYYERYYGKKEKDVEKAAYTYAKSIGCWHAKFKSAQNRGLPDRIFSTPTGVVFFIEFKRPKKKVGKDSLQRLVIDDMRAMGMKVFETNDLETAKQIIYNMVYFGDA